ncbi:MAG: hypothetical protein OZ922_14520 [Myxococcales bacterium]|nr:hypothetical protein [Myxococcales bacterium]
MADGHGVEEHAHGLVLLVPECDTDLTPSGLVVRDIDDGATALGIFFGSTLAASAHFG